jgi:RNA recognition motif-containing protein
LRRPDGKLIGCGFVEFEKREDAKTALEECSGKPLMSKIHTKFMFRDDK